VSGMAGRYTGSYLDRSYGWRVVAIPADIDQALLVATDPLKIRRSGKQWVIFAASEVRSRSGGVSHPPRRALPALTERRLMVSSGRASPEKQSEHIVEPYTDRGNGCRDVCPRSCSQNLLNSG
jgi:hypothetical protein